MSPSTKPNQAGDRSLPRAGWIAVRQWMGGVRTMSLRHTMMQENFDSVLEPAAPGRPAKLTIRLKVALLPLDPSAAVDPRGTTLPIPTHLADSAAQIRQGQVRDYNRNLFKCRSWLRSDWNKYQIRFIRAVEHAWNNQMILLPTPSSDPNDGLSDADYRQLMAGPGQRAYVEGAIDIQVVPPGGNAHATMEVVYLENNPGHFRVWMHRISDQSVQFASHGHPDWPGWSTGQITAAHEVGHWLKGLTESHFEHIDADHAKTLPVAQRARAQYGRTLGRKAALMGSGSLVTEHEAGPWLTRMRRHTSMKFGWSMMHSHYFRKVANELSDREKRL
jgi:hypothetical protein